MECCEFCCKKLSVDIDIAMVIFFKKMSADLPWCLIVAIAQKQFRENSTFIACCIGWIQVVVEIMAIFFR